jgi:NADH-quinone oxidoreductase subunit L
LHEEVLNWGVAASGLLAGLLGIGVATIMYWKPIIPPSAVSRSLPRAYAWLYNKYYFDEAYQWLIDRIVLGVSALAATFDRKIVNDGLVDWPSGVTVAAGRVLRFVQTGHVYAYALAFVVGVIVVGLMMAGFPNIRATLW